MRATGAGSSFRTVRQAECQLFQVTWQGEHVHAVGCAKGEDARRREPHRVTGAHEPDRKSDEGSTSPRDP
jgi:hypothetical protein